MKTITTKTQGIRTPLALQKSLNPLHPQYVIRVMAPVKIQVKILVKIQVKILVKIQMKINPVHLKKLRNPGAARQSMTKTTKA